MPVIYFVVFDQVEVLDFSGPFDVFSMAKIATRSNPYDLKLISADGAPITAIHGLKVSPDLALDQVNPKPNDIIILPGGTTDVINAIADGQLPTAGGKSDPSSLSPAQQDKLRQDCARIVRWLEGPAQNAGVICSICVGAFFAARAGLFAGQNSTTHHGFLDLLEKWVGTQSDLPPSRRSDVQHGVRYATNPTGAPLVMSSGGVSAGIDLSFELLERILCPNARHRTQVLMEYNGTTNFGAIQPKIPPGLHLCGHNQGSEHTCICGMDGPSPSFARHELRANFETH